MSGKSSVKTYGFDVFSRCGAYESVKCPVVFLVGEGIVVMVQYQGGVDDGPVLSTTYTMYCLWEGISSPLL